MAACSSNPGGPTSGLTYRDNPPDNTLPVIAAITAQGSRPRQPANFADLGETLSVSANVTDAETPIDQLLFSWSATAGTFLGSGASVTWQAPIAAATPLDVTIALRVIERYGPGGMLQHEVSRTRAVSLHDSEREVGDMARRFLTEFSRPQINQDWRDVMRDFDIDGRVCPDPSLVEAEREDVIEHYTNFFMHEHSIGAARVVFNFGGRCVIRNRPGDACVSVPVSWDSTDRSENKRAKVTGTDYLTAVFSSTSSRWWLCSSEFPRSAQTAGHSLYAR